MPGSAGRSQRAPRALGLSGAARPSLVRPARRVRTCRLAARATLASRGPLSPRRGVRKRCVSPPPPGAHCHHPGSAPLPPVSQIPKALRLHLLTHRSTRLKRTANTPTFMQSAILPRVIRRQPHTPSGPARCMPLQCWTAHNRGSTAHLGATSCRSMSGKEAPRCGVSLCKDVLTVTSGCSG